MGTSSVTLPVRVGFGPMGWGATVARTTIRISRPAACSTPALPAALPRPLAGRAACAFTASASSTWGPEAPNMPNVRAFREGSARSWATPRASPFVVDLHWGNQFLERRALQIMAGARRHRVRLPSRAMLLCSKASQDHPRRLHYGYRSPRACHVALRAPHPNFTGLSAPGQSIEGKRSSNRCTVRCQASVGAVAGL